MPARLRVVVRTSATRRRLRSILRWVRALVPAAAIAVAAPGAAAPLDDDGDDDAEVLVLDVDDSAGPLSVAQALVRARRAERPPGAVQA